MPTTIDTFIGNLRFTQKGILLVAVPLVFEVLFVGCLSVSYLDAQKEYRQAEHGRRVLMIADAISSGLFAAGATVYINPGDPETNGARFTALQATLNSLVDSLEQEARDYPAEKEHVRLISSSMKELTRRFADLQELARDPLQVIAQTDLRTTRRNTRRSLQNLVKAIDELIAYEDSQSGPRMLQAQQARARLHMLLYIGVLLNILLCLILAMAFSSQITKRLEVVSRNAIAMSKKENPQESLSGKDELADLDQLIHKLSVMLIETSRRERALIDNTLEVVIAMDPTCNILTTNAAVQKNWGWEPESMAGTPVSQLIPAERRNLLAAFLEDVKKNTSVNTFDCEVLRRDGSFVECRWSCFWSATDESYFAMVRDISDEKEADRLRKQFFSMISHDLRSPLANVRAFLTQLGDGTYGKLNQSGEKFQARLIDNVDYLINLTGDLLELAKLQGRRISLNQIVFKPDEMIDECCALLETLAQEKNIKLTVEIQNPAQMFGDEIRLKQVMTNLFSNAIRFSPTGGVITLAVWNEGAQRFFAVRDQGPGLPESDCAKVFEPFVQGETTKEGDTKNFGLGLAIAKSVVEAHGGSIGARPLKQGGTEFWFSIPDARQADSLNAANA